MSHDFLDSGVNDPRFDSQGVSCKGIGGVMDYYQPAVTRWSTCSVEDFKALYNNIVDNGGTFCIATAAPETSTTTTTTTPAPETSTTTTTTTTRTATTTTKCICK